MEGLDGQQYAVLYVDDEEQSLKYFRKAFEKDFRVLTAGTVAEALETLQREPENVGILLTDQRMPGQSGTDLLGKVRQSRPEIVRILTTAYSDLDSAIEAVNSGAIFRYVTKPWNVRDLRGLLLRAMDFYVVQRERDLLVREKLSVLQRLIITDRVRSLAVLAAGLAHHIRNSMVALTTFLDLAVTRLEDGPEFSMLRDPEFLRNVWDLAQQESQRILQIVQQVVDETVEPSSAFNAVVPLADLVRSGADNARESRACGATVEIDVDPALPPLKVDQAMGDRLWRVLLTRAARLSGPDRRVKLTAREAVPVWGAPGVKVSIQCDGPSWTDERLSSLFTVFSPAEDDPNELGTDLLSAFFIVHHHGGEILVHQSAPEGPGFEVRLPFDPDAAQRPSLEEGCMEKLFTHFETWESFRRGT